MNTFTSKWLGWSEGSLTTDRTDKTSLSLLKGPTDSLTKPTEPPWDENRAREDLNAAFDWADAESRRRGIPWARAWQDRPPELHDSMNQALDAIDAAWKHHDPAVYGIALEGFRQAVTNVLDASQPTTAEGGDAPA